MEFTLSWIAEEIGLLKALEGGPHSDDVVLHILVVVQCVIQVVLYVLIQEWCEHLVHVPLEARGRIGEAKGHHSESEGAKWHHEGCFPLVSRLDTDLVVA